MQALPAPAMTPADIDATVAEIRAKRYREGIAAQRPGRVHDLARALDALGALRQWPTHYADLVRGPKPETCIIALRTNLQRERERAAAEGVDPSPWCAALDKLGALWCVL